MGRIDEPEAEQNKAAGRKLDPARTRADIIAVARAEFCEHGLSGARVDAIAARTRTTKRMLYYYFGSKEGLYLAVLEQAFAEIASFGRGLDLARLAPAEAIRRLVDVTCDYHEAHPEFSRLLGIETIHHGKYLAQSDGIRTLAATAVETLSGVIRRGQRDGTFRRGIDPVDVHLMINAFCLYRAANRHTFGLLFGCDLADPDLRARHKRLFADAVLRSLERNEAEATGPRPKAA